MKKLQAALVAVFLLFAMLVFAPSRHVLATTYTKLFSVWIKNSLIDNTPIGSTTPSTGAFTTSSASGGYTGNVTGNVTGNASTATALAAAPSTCGSTGISAGIQANGACIQAPSWVPRTCNVNGCYLVLPDGTYIETVSGITMNNDTTTTITLPHSIPTIVMSSICNDDSSRVQSGNVFPIGSNTAGQSAPFTYIQALAAANGVTARCIIWGY